MRSYESDRVIRVSIENLHPLTGSVAVEDGERRQFCGWLELLQAVSDLVDAAGATGDVFVIEESTD